MSFGKVRARFELSFFLDSQKDSRVVFVLSELVFKIERMIIGDKSEELGLEVLK